ncbi:MAG: MFS transporter [Chloroflexi bacterium]|nr:MFS transporter [Chloroflexota bacterium]
MKLLSVPRVFYGWWIVLAGFAIQWTVGALMLHPFGIYVVEFEEEFGWSRTKLSVAFSLARVEDGLLGPFQGWMIDRFGPRAVIRVGVVLFALGFVAFSMMNSLLMFYLTFLLMAVGAALAGFLSVTTAVVNWFVRRRTLAVSLALIGVAGGGFAAPGIAYLIEEIGWRNTALVSAAIIAIVGLPAAQLVRHRPEPYGLMPDGDSAPPAASADDDGPQFAEVSMTPQQALRSRAFWAISFAHAAALLVVSAVMVHFVAHVEEQLDYSRTQAASLITVLTVMVIIGQVVGGWAGDRLNTRAIIAVCLIGHATAMLLLTFATALWMVVAFALLHGIAWGVRGPVILSMRAEYFGPHSFGTIMGFSSLIVMLGMIIGPIFAGLVYDNTGSYEFGFTLLALIAGASSLLMLWAGSPPPRPERRPTTAVAAEASEAPAA